MAETKLPGTARISASAESVARLHTFALCFQRWCKTNSIDSVLPQPFAVQLAERVVQRCCELHVGATFNLRLRSKPESSATTCIYQVATKKDGRALELQLVRKNDTDTHLLDFEHNKLDSENGHWMAGSTYAKGLALPKLLGLRGGGVVETASRVIHDWFEARPNTLLRAGRAAIVRPSDLAGDGSCPSVPLCDAAKAALRENKTLLLVKGALDKVPLVEDPSMFVAGYIFREPLPEEQKAEDDAMKEKEKEKEQARAGGAEAKPSWPALHLRLESLIVAERLVRTYKHGSPDDGGTRKPYQGQVLEPTSRAALCYAEWRHDNGPPFTSDGMYDWQPHDVYAYAAGRW